MLLQEKIQEREHKLAMESAMAGMNEAQLTEKQKAEIPAGVSVFAKGGRADHRLGGDGDISRLCLADETGYWNSNTIALGRDPEAALRKQRAQLNKQRMAEIHSIGQVGELSKLASKVLKEAGEANKELSSNMPGYSLGPEGCHLIALGLKGNSSLRYLKCVTRGAPARIAHSVQQFVRCENGFRSGGGDGKHNLRKCQINHNSDILEVRCLLKHAWVSL